MFELKSILSTVGRMMSLPLMRSLHNVMLFSTLQCITIVTQRGVVDGGVGDVTPNQPSVISLVNSDSLTCGKIY